MQDRYPLLISCCALALFGAVACSDSDGADDNARSNEPSRPSETRDAGPKKRDAAADAAANRGDDEDDDDDDDTGDDDDTQVVRDGAVSPPRMDAGRTPTSSSDARATLSDGSAAPADAARAEAGSAVGLKPFSFFMTSLKAIRELAKDQNGFGGDLRFGETGEGAGLRGADKICTAIAEKSMPGSGVKGWRAFLSTTKGGPNGGPVHAISRIGEGPWYDRLGRIVAMNVGDIAQVRPATADPAIKNDLPNEDGVPNHNPDGTGEVDNHHVLTGSNDKGQLYANNVASTCADWTKSAAETADAPRVGLSWPRGGGGGANAQHWLSAMDESGCGKGINLIQSGGPNAANPTVGSGGGYGGIYCFALMP